MEDREGLFQNLRDFTVQVRDARTDTIVGTGIVVADGKIVTCAHVVRQAGMNPEGGGPIRGWWSLMLESLGLRRAGALDETNHTEVGVYFPQAPTEEAKTRRATLAASFLPEHQDDVVVLELVDGPPPLSDERFAVLGRPNPEERRQFCTYGYAPRGKFPADTADGLIVGCIEAGAGMQADTVKLQCDPLNQIRPGMSGGAVLDIKQNLVVGIVSDTLLGLPLEDKRIGWAVNAQVLSLAPLKLSVRDKPLPRRPLPRPQTDEQEARMAAVPDPGRNWHGEPVPLNEWVGRKGLLESLNADWENTVRHVVGLIGFGGEGKSSLARRWVDALLADQSRLQPDGVFWWTFRKPDAEEFFEWALALMTRGRINLADHPSARERVQIIAAALSARRYLFVLDGLESLQRQAGDQYGLLTNADLREFLQLFAAPGHTSCCLVTSRAPLLDLIGGYKRYDVERLVPGEGRELLRKLGVKGPDPDLGKVVADWDGHALTLTLLGSYLVARYKGEVEYIDEIPSPTADEPHYDRVRRVLLYYDRQLTDAERSFLTLFSAFRIPVREESFAGVFRANQGPQALNAPVAALDDQAFNAMIKRLIEYRLLRYSAQDSCYTTHPLIREHYYRRLIACERGQAQATQERIKEYYLAVAEDHGPTPTLRDLSPLVEAVYHSCHAGAYEEGCRLYRERIERGAEMALSWKLNAYDTVLALMREFFPSGDTSQAPLLSDLRDQRYVLNRMGVALTNTGRPREVPPFYERAIAVAKQAGDTVGTIHTCQNLAELYSYVGPISASAGAAQRGLELARSIVDKEEERDSLAYLGWAAHLSGDLALARASFHEAEVLQQETDPDNPHLSDMWGAWHADFLRRAGELDHAQRVTLANLKISKSEEKIDNISICHRVLGDLSADLKRHDRARRHYARALKIVRAISERTVLLEVLLGRGRWAARRGEIGTAGQDLAEALRYADAGGYRIYEADIRVALAWMHRAAGNVAEARSQAETAQRMSDELGYHWGRVDAAEVIESLS
jgi:tetratricopeptide (TPR) repeat protein